MGKELLLTGACLGFREMGIFRIVDGNSQGFNHVCWEKYMFTNTPVVGDFLGHTVDGSEILHSWDV